MTSFKNFRLGIYINIMRLAVKLNITLPPNIMYICGSDSLPAPLTPEEEAYLIASYNDGGDN
ncbi:MAG: sporulation sigma factor SigE, partial [Clostridia bacterium]